MSANNLAKEEITVPATKLIAARKIRTCKPNFTQFWGNRFPKKN